jgi:ATP-dependent DNA helicase RecQ
LSASTQNPLQILQNVYGFDSFRGEQEEIIGQIVLGEDALVLMPTGGGKSLCYQIPALCREGLGVVVSPLIALMQDQVDSLLQLGVKAAFLNSSLSYEDARRTEQLIRAGELDLIYVAPERLVMPEFMALLREIPLALFAIDEAHCVSQWGHDFRPEYLQLQCLHEQFPNVPRVALTATADNRTREEIINKLHLEEAQIFLSSFNRPNIQYQVVLKNKPQDQLLHFMQTHHRGEAGIVYCLSRKKVDATAAWLKTQNIKALPYHAGLSALQRAQHQKAFLREDGIIMVATIAFGMGIDKPDVRFVAHLDCPKSMESYYQETGRAGRDGLPSTAWMCYNLADVVALRRMMSSSEAPPEIQRADQQRLSDLLGYCETQQCRRKVILEYFDEPHPDQCGNCDNCLEPAESWDATIAAQKILSCVFRSGQNFGAHHIVDILLGEAKDKVIKFKHDQLSTFGIGQEHNRSTWLSVIRQLTLTDYLSLDAQYGSLSLAPKSRAILKNEQKLLLRKDVASQQTKSSRNSAASTSTPHLSPAQTALFMELKSWRRQKAEAQNIAPYLVTTDKVLHDLCVYTPQTDSELECINGIGKHKIAQYGTDLITTIGQHPEALKQKSEIQNSLQTRSDRNIDRKNRPSGDTVQLSIALFRRGHSIETIAKERELNPSTIQGHLCKGIENGSIEFNEICTLGEMEVTMIIDFMNHLPKEGPFLRSVFDHFEERYSFETLKAVQALRQTKLST